MSHDAQVSEWLELRAQLLLMASEGNLSEMMNLIELDVDPETRKERYNFLTVFPPD